MLPSPMNNLQAKGGQKGYKDLGLVTSGSVSPRQVTGGCR